MPNNRPNFLCRVSSKQWGGDELMTTRDTCFDIWILWSKPLVSRLAAHLSMKVGLFTIHFWTVSIVFLCVSDQQLATCC